MICNAELRPNNFFVNVFVLAFLYLANNFQKTNNFAWNCQFFENCQRNTIASKKTFTENSLQRNFSLHFTSYLSIALSKILPHSKKKKLRNCQYLVKTTFAVYLVFYKLIFFESLIIFLKPTLKLITRIFDLQK